MLGRYRHVINQQAWPWQWEHIDALYKVADHIPTWVVGDSVMAVWVSGKEDLSNSFTNWDSPETEVGMALMLSRGSSCLGLGSELEGKKVYSALVVFVHPRQELVTIKQGAGCLITTVDCQTAKPQVRRYYPSAVNHTYLVLPYLSKKETPKKLHLDMAMCYNCQLMVHWLHRWEGRLGDVALLPPVFSRDPTILILLPVGFISELWLNKFYNTPVDAGGLGLGKACPAITRLACCHLEVSANKTLVDWTDEGHVVYPAATPAPKDDTTNEPADEAVNDPDDANDNANDANDDANNDPADDDKSEHDDDESDENAMPKKEEDESEDESGDESKLPKDQSAVLRDSGLGASSASLGIGVGASVSTLIVHSRIKHDTGLPLPTRLPSMGALEELANDLYAYSGELFRGLEETSMAMLDRILSGFKKSGGRAHDYIHETATIALNFFSRAGEMEAELESSEVLKFRNTVNGMKDSIRNLIRLTAMAEESYEEAAAQFDNILSSVSDELKELVEARGKGQWQEYITKCMDRIRGIHGSLDGTQFIPMIVTNTTTHHALSLSARVNQSQIPLQIMISPMWTQAATMGARLKFVEFLSRRVLALDVKLGPMNAVSLESGGEGSGVQSASGGGTTPAVASTPAPKKPDSLKMPVTTRTPPTANHTYGAPKAKTPETPSKPQTMLSPTTSATLAKFKGVSDDDKAPRKRRAKSVSREVPTKKAKVDVDSDSYSSLTPSKSEPPKKAKKNKKKKAPSSDESSSSSDDEQPSPKKPIKDSRADAIAWANQDCTSKWKKDLKHVVRYRQRKGLCTKELIGSPNNTHHIDLLTQLLHEGQLGLNITQLDARIEEVSEDAGCSKQACRLLKALQEVRGETMGCSGIYTEYVVRAFLVPDSQSVIQKGNNNHWDTSAMIRLYNLHKYEAVGKGNKKVDSKMVTKGYWEYKGSIVPGTTAVSTITFMSTTA